MRKIFAVTAIALLGFAGQAAATEGVASLTPSLGQIGYVDGDAAGGVFGTEGWTLDALGALLLIGGTVALLSSSDRHDDTSQSA